MICHLCQLSRCCPMPASDMLLCVAPHLPLRLCCSRLLHLRVHRPPLNAVKAVAMEAVMPLFRAAVERAEDLIIKLHDCNFATATEAAVTHASPPTGDLARHLMHCRQA